MSAFTRLVLPFKFSAMSNAESFLSPPPSILTQPHIPQDLDGEASGGDDDFFVEEAQDYVGRGGRKKSKKKKQSVSQQEGGGVSASMGTLGAEDEVINFFIVDVFRTN